MNFWQKMALGVLFAPSVVILGGCDSLWDAEMDVSPDYYGVGVSVPTYGYNPGPPPIDPNIWGPVWGNWNGPIGYYPPAPPMGVRPGGNSYNPGFSPNLPTGNIRPGYNQSTSVTPPAQIPESGVTVGTTSKIANNLIHRLLAIFLSPNFSQVTYKVTYDALV